MKRIALIGPLYESNLGDPLLFDCTEYICKQIEKESNEYIKLDILAREKIQGHVPNINIKNIHYHIEYGIVYIVDMKNFFHLLKYKNLETTKKNGSLSTVSSKLD